jgi:hypothetical protein
MARGEITLLDWLRRDGDSSNTTIGIILLLMLLVFIGPNILPSILSRSLAFVDEGVPCTRLRSAENRGFHQSLIGRNARNPLEIRVLPSAAPNTIDGTLTIRIVIENMTIGSVPVVFDEQQIIVGDDGASSGFGLIFTPPTNITTGLTRTTGGGIVPDSSIRILGPRQRCVHRVNFPANGLDPNILAGNVAVQAYYRVTTTGAIGGGIYPDHGLGIIQGGYLQSDPILIPPAPATAPIQ